GVDAAADVLRRHADDVAAAGTDIDTGAKRRVLHLLGDDVSNYDIGAVRSGKDDVLAAAAGERPPGGREFMFALERPEAFVAAVARVDVDDHQLLGGHAEVGVWHAQAEP